MNKRETTAIDQHNQAIVELQEENDRLRVALRRGNERLSQIINNNYPANEIPEPASRDQDIMVMREALK